MKIRHTLSVKWTSLFLCILALTLVLVACGTTGGDTTTTTPTPTPTPTPIPTTKTYPGDGYTLSYPKDWTYTTQGTTVTFTSNSDPTITFAVSALPTGTTPQAYLATLASQYQNWKQDTTVPPTATVGGQTWQALGATGDQGQYHLKGVALYIQYPANTGKYYVILLTAKTTDYDNVYTTWFKPILDSYKFS